MGYKVLVKGRVAQAGTIFTNVMIASFIILIIYISNDIANKYLKRVGYFLGYQNMQNL